MNWIAFAPLLAATVLLVLQGCSYLSLKNHTTQASCEGGLAILGAALGLTLYFLLATGALILGSEFRVVMAQGIPARVGLGVLIVGVAIAVGLGWHVAHAAMKLDSRLEWILGGGIAVGLIAVFRMGVLNPDDPVQLRVACYDLWWPWSLIWVSACFTDSILTARGIRHRWARVEVAMLFTTGLSLEAVRRSHAHFGYASPDSLVLWETCLRVLLPVVMVLGTLLAFETPEIQRYFRSRWLRISASTLLGFVGLISAGYWVLDFPRSPLHSLPIPWFIWLVSLVSLGLVARRSIWAALTLSHLGNQGRLADCIGVLALCAAVAALADIFRFGRLDPVWDLVGLILSWVILMELLGGRPLRELAERLKAYGETARLRLARHWKAIIDWLKELPSGIRRWVGELLEVKKIASGIVKVVVLVILVSALAEIPNAGKTIIVPFSTAGLPKDDKDRDLGRVVADRIANTLGLLGQELQPDMLVFSPSEDSRKAVRLSAVTEESGASQVTVQTSDLDIPGIGFKIPLSLLTTPIERPMRWLLHTRVIHGSIQKDGDRYTLLVNSTRGETWQTEGIPQQSSSPAGNGKDTESSNHQKSSKTTRRGNNPSSAQQPSTGSIEIGPNSNRNDGRTAGAPEGMADLAEEMAYKIMSADPALARTGMSQSWQAILPFRTGLLAWKEYTAAQDYGALSNSIKQFWAVVKADPDFALAQYRLGRALTEDGQPYLAARAFREALRASPRFAAAHIALASTLYNLEDYYYPLPPAISQSFEPESLAEAARRNEALGHWKQVVQLSGAEASMANRASAYGGLCYDAITSFQNESNGRRPYPYLALFYCKRAENVYARLAPLLRADPQVRAVEASVLHYLGYVLESSGPTSEMRHAPSEPNWYCSEATINNGGIRGSLYADKALEYFQSALVLFPKNPDIRCAIANTRLSQGYSGPMQDLGKDASAHAALAQRLSYRAEESVKTGRVLANLCEAMARLKSPLKPKQLAEGDKHACEREYEAAGDYYRQALREYEQAIALAPADSDALNNYAYTFWQWMFNLPTLGPPLGPDRLVAKNAEEYARRAVSLDTGRVSAAQLAMEQSTLGEVLIANGKYGQAIEKLSDATKSVPSDSAFFNEIRWDLAQAYLCTRNRSKASSILETIKTIEETREERPFTDEVNLLDAPSVSNVCRQRPRVPSKGGNAKRSAE